MELTTLDVTAESHEATPYFEDSCLRIDYVPLLPNIEPVQNTTEERCMYFV